MSKTLYTINDEICIEAKPCTYQEFKADYELESNEYSDLYRGFDVEFPTVSGELFNVFIPACVWNKIAHEY